VKGPWLVRRPALLWTVAGIGTAMLLAACGGSILGSPRGNFSVEEARAFREFPVYYVGDSFRELPLTAVLRQKVEPYPGAPPIRPNYVSFIYGTCDASGGDGGCAPPLEIQTHPSCLSTPADVSRYVTVDGTATVRGVKGVFYDLGSKLVLVTGRSTVSIYARGRREVLAVARSLRGANVPIRPRVELPPPPPASHLGTCRDRPRR
jgi:hypothetical protein